jgi:hypothetical protein
MLSQVKSYLMYRFLPKNQLRPPLPWMDLKHPDGNRLVDCDDGSRSSVVGHSNEINPLNQRPRLLMFRQ